MNDFNKLGEAADTNTYINADDPSNTGRADNISKKANRREQAVLRIYDDEERKRYIDGCLSQMYEGAKAMEALKTEYNEVSGLISDIDALSSLPQEVQERIKSISKRIHGCEEKSEAVKESGISEQDYSRMERIENEYGSAIDKFDDAEDYHKKVKNDLKRLALERDACYMREDDLEKVLKNTHKLSVFCMISLITVLFVLAVMQIALHFNVLIGYLLSVVLGAVSIAVMYHKNITAQNELKTVESSISRLILLQNTVKIRYVNNRNLLDYYSMKYGVDKSQELKKLASEYEKEKQVRLLRQDAQKEIEEARAELLKILSGGRFKYPEKWVYMIDVISQRQQEMEYRRQLIARRKTLRERMDYNQDKVTEKAKNEIKRIVEKYPRYAEEISLQMDAFIREKEISI